VPSATPKWSALMSALGHKQTSADLFDHLVGAGEQRGRNGNSKGFGCLEIDDQLEFRRLLDRKVGGLLTLEDAIDIGCGAAEQIGALNSVGDQASAPGELRNRIDCRQVLLRRQGDDHLVTGIKETVRQSDQVSGLLAACHRNGTAKFDLVANGRNDQLECRVTRTASIAGRNIRANGAESGLNMTVIDSRRGTISLSSCTHFAPMLGSSVPKPVTLPPGWAKLCMKPWATGSAMATNTMGIVWVACRAATNDGVELATRMSGLSRFSKRASRYCRYLRIFASSWRGLKGFGT